MVLLRISPFEHCSLFAACEEPSWENPGVGLNTDASVRLLKGPRQNRLPGTRSCGNFGCVNGEWYVVIFNGNDVMTGLSAA